MKAITVILILGLSLILMACSSTPTTQTEDVASMVSYPENMPENIPIHPEAKLLQVRESETDTSEDISLSLSAKASVSDINTWYRGAMKSDGWTIKSDKTVAGYTIIQAENGNLYTSMQATGTQEEGVSAISQSVKIRSE